MFPPFQRKWSYSSLNLKDPQESINPNNQPEQRRPSQVFLIAAISRQICAEVTGKSPICGWLKHVKSPVSWLCYWERLELKHWGATLQYRLNSSDVPTFSDAPQFCWFRSPSSYRMLSKLYPNELGHDLADIYIIYIYVLYCYCFLIIIIIYTLQVYIYIYTMYIDFMDLHCIICKS